MAFARSKAREPVGEAGLFEYAVGALSRKMRTERDLRRLMRARTFPGDEGERAMDAVVVRLVELKYLSDVRFAEDFTRMRKENQGYGRRRVQQDLAGKGVEKDLVAATVGAAYDEADEVALARAYCERKRLQKPKDQKETARVMNRLMRAGYSSGPIFKVLRSWDVPVPEEGAGDFDSYAERDEGDERVED